MYLGVVICVDDDFQLDEKRRNWRRNTSKRVKELKVLDPKIAQNL